jgi:ComF family protein
MGAETDGVKAASGGASAALRLLRRVAVLALDQLYPPVCLACDAAVATPDALCSACFRRLRPITRPFCPRLGLPFEVSLGPEALSAEAISDPPPFDRARSCVVYNGVARALVGRLKYGDRPELARFCARLMAATGHEFWDAKPVLVPVPLHRTRLFSRRFNQAAELGREIARLTGLAHDPGLVIRRKPTRQQVGLSGEQRRRNLEGAFALDPRALQRLAGRPVVLIDDVITTGSTVKAVTRALQRGGVERVDVLSFARVVIGLETD